MLLGIFTVLSLGGGLAVAALTPLSFLWVPLLFLGFFIGLSALFMLLFLVIAAFSPKEGMRQKDDKVFRALFNLLLPFFFFFAGARIKVTGEEKLPREGRFLLVCNHLSTFDALVAISVFPWAELAYISKPENFDMPVFGRLVRRLCFMPIDRGNPRHALDTVQNAVSLLKRDEVSVAVFPEGTRNRTEVGLLPFHEGVFLIAEKADVPLAIITLTNCQKICRNFPFRKTEICLDVAEVIPKEEIRKANCRALSERVRGAMEESLKKNGYPFAPEEAQSEEVREGAVV